MRALPAVARAVSSSPDAYVYLAESIRAWPDQAASPALARAGGLGRRRLAQPDAAASSRCTARHDAPNPHLRPTLPTGAREEIHKRTNRRPRTGSQPPTPQLLTAKDAPACRRSPLGTWSRTPTSSSSAPARADPRLPRTSPAPGCEVLLLEKTTFPREKVCGDGLTPRAVKSLLSLGIDTADWPQNRGLRIFGGRHRLELDWPDLASYPSYGLVRPRHRLRRGARPHRAEVRRQPARGHHRHRPAARRAHRPHRRRHASRTATSLRAPLVHRRRRRQRPHRARRRHREARRPAAGRRRPRLPRTRAARTQRPVPGVATSSSGTARRGEGRLLPGYGWVFGVGDGTVNVGLGILNTSEAFGNVDYKDLLRRWLNGVPDLAGVELVRPGPRRRAADGLQPPAALPRRSAADRRRGRRGEPVQRRGHRVRDGDRRDGRRHRRSRRSARPAGPAREQALRGLPARRSSARYGGYFTLGPLVRRR